MGSSSWRGTNTRLILDGSMPSKNSSTVEEIKLKMAILSLEDHKNFYTALRHSEGHLSF